MLNSVGCRFEHFQTSWYEKWCGVLGFDPAVKKEVPVSYRKIWEWCAILEALQNRDMLRAGRRGLGFAVGSEALPSIFANMGVEVMATDLAAESSDEQWKLSGQHAANLDALFSSKHVNEEDFRRLVSFQPADMTDLSAMDGGYDFLWSSCAMEHLGTLDRGTEFVKNAMRLLKPGGVAVHTTEFNCTSNDDTMTQGWNVIYRRRDLERLAGELRAMRCAFGPIDFDLGYHHFDIDYDTEPYCTGNGVHIKLMIDGFVSTSFLIVVEKFEM